MTLDLSDLEVLARCPLFAELPTQDLEALAAVARRRRYTVGESVFLAGERSEGLRVMVSGRIKIFILSPKSGREVILTVEHPYHTVAELPSFDQGTYPANGQALEDAETLFLEQATFERVLRQRPEISLHLLRALGIGLRGMVELIEQVSFQEVVQRLAEYLLSRAHNELPFTLETNAAIAAQLGTVPELVSRNLSRLHQSGAVRLSSRVIAEVNEAALRDLAESAGR